MRATAVVGAADRLSFGGRRFVQADFDRSGAQAWMSVVSIAPGVTVVNVVVTRGGAKFPLRLLQMMGAGGRCTPTIFLDEARPPIVESDWDLFIPLDKIEAIEVYSATAAPAMFRGFNGNCGSVAMWTRADAR